MLTGSIDVRGDRGRMFAHGREHKALTGVKQHWRVITPVTTIADRLKEARLELGLSQKQLARRAGVSAGTIGNIEAGARDEPQKLVEIATAAQVTPQWLKLGKGPKRPANWTHEQHPLQGLSIHPEDHDLSQPQPEDDPTTMSWESLLSAVTLPARFRLSMPDDALAPSTPRGTVLIFSTRAQPVYGHGVLVRDASGSLHVRRYAQGPAGRWLAEARNSAYMTLDSADGLEMLASVVGRETGDV